MRRGIGLPVVGVHSFDQFADQSALERMMLENERPSSVSA
jgi:hypothetical protein